MKRFQFILGLMMVAFWSSGQQRMLQGEVRNQHTKFPVAAVTISSIPGNEVTSTNEEGRFALRLTPTDTALLLTSIESVGRFIRIADLDTTSTIYIETASVQLKAVTIAGSSSNQFAPISKIDIALRGINNSQEILRMVPGLFIGQHAGGGKAEQIFLRGFDLDHGTDINLTVDGMPVNMVSHAHGQGYADLHFLIPEAIQTVNFKKGTYFAEKGNLATSGFVNFKTLDILPANVVKIEGGMFNTARTLGMFNLLPKDHRNKQESMYAAVEYMCTDGYFENPQDFSRLNLFTKYVGRLSANSSMSISLSSFRSTWNASGQIPDRAVSKGIVGFYGAIDPNEGGKTNRSDLNMQLITTLPNGAVLRNQLFYSHYNFELYSNFTFFKEDPVNGDQIRQKEARNLAGYNGSFEQVRYIGEKRLTSIVGVNTRTDFTAGSELSRTRNRTEVLLPIQLGDIKETNVALYTDQTLRLTERISLNAGIRFDKFFNRYVNKLQPPRISSSEAAIVSPKLNLYFNMNKQVQLYASAGKGFHSNDTRVVVAEGGLKTLPAAYGADLGTVLKPTSNLLLNIAGWYLFMEQEFVYVGDEGVTEPSGKSRRIGIDFSARYQPLAWLFLDADLNYSHARSVEEPRGANLLPLAPRFTSIGGITIKTGRHINGSIRYRYMGDRPANEDNTVVARGYFITDAAINYKRSAFEVFVTLQNLFNTRWKETQFDTESQLQNEPAPVSEIHFTPGTPFSLKAGFSYSF